MRPAYCRVDGARRPADLAAYDEPGVDRREVRRAPAPWRHGDQGVARRGPCDHLELGRARPLLPKSTDVGDGRLRDVAAVEVFQEA